MVAPLCTDSNGRYRQSVEFGEDRVGGLGPSEGFGVIVVLGQIAIDGGLKIEDRSEHTAPEALASEFGEKAFDGIEPGAGLWGEVEGPAWVAGEPGFDLGMFVGAVIGRP